MRPVSKKSDPGLSVKNYSMYRVSLTSNIGYYCSYCERRLEHGIEIEHIKPKDLYPDLELRWDNLLIACRNCNAIKGRQDINLEEYFWPHLDNTAKAFDYSTSGIIRVASNITNEHRKIAEKTIKLVGLDRTPSLDTVNNPEERDNRWRFRMQAWDKAEECRNDLLMSDTPTLRKLIVEMAVSTGYFSVWMSVFQSDLLMKKELITAFLGTDINCYHEETLDYLPKGRL